MKIQCIIIEDEPLAMEKLKGFVMKHPDLILKSTFNNGADALVFLQTNNVDLLFLDINLGEMSGIRILETANISANVILTTAYSEFALKGYELNVTDYRRIFTVNKNIMTLQTFKELEEELPKTIICRVHKSYMVGLQKIDSVQKDEIHIGNKIIPVSETYKKEFYDLIR